MKRLSPKPGSEQNSREPILIVLVAGIGDLICASKTMRALRTAFPGSAIHLLTSTDAAPLARNYPYLGRVWEFPIRELRTSLVPIFGILKLVMMLRKRRFAMAMNLYPVSSLRGAMTMGMLFALLRAPVKIGQAARGFGLFVNRKVPAAAIVGRHCVDGMMAVAAAAGAGIETGGVEVFWKKESEAKWRSLFDKEPGRPAGPVIAVNPGGDRPGKRWAVERFAETADRFVNRFGARILILGGPADVERGALVCTSMKNAATDLAGRLTLDELAFVISRLDLLVTNDSAAMHIAAACAVKQVAIFGADDPAQFHPYVSSETYRIVRTAVGCNPCAKGNCASPACLDAVTVDDVFNAAASLLSLTRERS